MSERHQETATAVLLVVDDDRLTRKTLMKVLTKAGYEVVEAADGLEALELAASCRPDMVLLDVLMPRMDGYTACRELRKIADHQALPIMMLTGLNDMASIDDAFDAGATDFITKPLNWTLLTQRVRYALRTKEMGIALRRNQERLSQAQRLAKLGYWELDLRSQNVHCSDELYLVLGLDEATSIAEWDAFLQMVAEEERSRVREAIELAVRQHRAYELEHRVQRADGMEIIVLQQGEVEVDEDGVPLTVLGTLQDITERKKAEALIEYQAYYDSLTDLPNRRLFTDHVQHAIALAHQQRTQVGVIFMGIDRFKVINDTMGHAAGDKLLHAVSERLKGVSIEGVSLGRFGADVFAVLLEGTVQISEIDACVSTLLQRLAEPFSIQGEEFFITASAGVALYPHDVDDAAGLLKAADSAMFRAKEAGGRQFQYFTPDMNAQARKRFETEQALRKALERGEFRVFYQPQVDAGTRRIIGMEALIRWQEPGNAMIAPIDFIPVAEDSGLIVPIGSWVLRTACRTTREWNERYGLKLRVGVNLSGRQFAEPNLTEVVAEALRESGLSPDCLDLEVTESIAMDDIDGCIRTLQHLHEMGIHASMDDFGTGYSSLSYLQRMPLDILKIDRAFIKDIQGNGENGDIAKAIIAMAHSLGLKVIAEGVESEEQLRFLRDHGCDVIQGFYTGRPLDAEAFESMLIQQVQSPPC